MIARVLIVDDDKRFAGMLVKLVQNMGHTAAAACTLKKGTEEAQTKQFDVVLLDVNLPDGSGLDAIPLFQRGAPPPEVIIITGFGGPDGAELAMNSGVWDYLDKGSSLDSIQLSVTQALRYRESKMAAAVPVALKMAGMIGSSRSFISCLDLLAQAAKSDANLLITGESGTGKELFANAVHENSSRAERPFVVVDCTALPETLVESVLFGHEKGVFTGAEQAREGLVKQADGGTLFLDEVGELPLSIQKAFLRVLQERRFRPIGSDKEVPSNFRLIAATNRDLDQMVEEGRFRRDLLFRLRSLTVVLPLLRNRAADIKPLAFHYVARFCDLRGVEQKGFAPGFFEVLHACDWPGNVRELVNTLEGAVALAGDEPILYVKHLPSRVRVHSARASYTKNENHINSCQEDIIPPNASVELALKDFLANLREKGEKRYLQTLVDRTGGKISEVSRISGLSTSRLYQLLKKHGIPLTK